MRAATSRCNFAQDEAGIAQKFANGKAPNDAYGREGAHDIDRRSQTGESRETRRFVKCMPEPTGKAARNQ